jgi:hypothetical protein
MAVVTQNSHRHPLQSAATMLRNRMRYENAAGQQPCPCMTVPEDLSGDDSRERAGVLRRAASRPAGRFVDWVIQRQTCAVNRRWKTTRHYRRPIAKVSASTAITYPHPQRPRRSALGESGQHGGMDPNFLTYSARTSTRPSPPDAFAQVTGLRPKVPRTAKRHRFDTPARYIRRASEPRFRRSEALSGTWWQVKDSNLRSFRDGFTDHRLQARNQRQCLSPNKLPGVFPTDSRRQPTSAVANRTPQAPTTLSPRTLYTYLTDEMQDADRSEDEFRSVGMSSAAGRRCCHLCEVGCFGLSSSALLLWCAGRRQAFLSPGLLVPNSTQPHSVTARWQSTAGPVERVVRNVVSCVRVTRC